MLHFTQLYSSFDTCTAETNLFCMQHIAIVGFVIIYSSFLGQLGTGLIHYIPMPRHVFTLSTEHSKVPCLATD